jgi:protein-disulfide isomerase
MLRMHPLKSIAAACALSLALAACNQAGTGSYSPAQREALQKEVREYLLANPEILQEMQKAEVKKREDALREKGVAMRPQLENSPGDFVAGNVNSKIVVVEFFDYRCPYCKAASAWTDEAIQKNPDVKFILKQFPILGPGSELAARAGLAAQRQGKFLPLHNGLMNSKGEITQGLIEAIATRNGINVAQLRRDMNASDIMVPVLATYEIAKELGLQSTPTYAVNGVIVEGFKPDVMEAAIKETRERIANPDGAKKKG